MFCTFFINLGNIGLEILDLLSILIHYTQLIWCIGAVSNDKEFWGFKEIRDFNMVLIFFVRFIAFLGCFTRFLKCLIVLSSLEQIFCREKQ
jgi:hypothetical protein